MSKGRGSAAPAVFVLALCVVIVAAQVDVVRSTTYTVGAAGGWTFNVVSWPDGKRFRAGDVLVFNYDRSSHNVVLVDQAGYTVCKTPTGARVFTSGSDKITLARGQNYFICNFPGHCQSAMKIAVMAT